MQAINVWYCATTKSIWCCVAVLTRAGEERVERVDVNVSNGLGEVFLANFIAKSLH